MTTIDDNLDSLKLISGSYKTRLSNKFKKRKLFKPVNPAQVFSYIPGTVVEILVAEGQYVKAGDDLLILEAMKMKNRLKSSINGKISKIHAVKNEKVAKGVLLIDMEAEA